MELLIALGVLAVIAGLIYWAVHKLAGVFGLPPQIVVVFDVILVVVVILAMLRILLPGRIPGF